MNIKENEKKCNDLDLKKALKHEGDRDTNLTGLEQSLNAWKGNWKSLKSEIVPRPSK